MTGSLLLQWYLGYNFSVAVWVGYIVLFGIAVETGVVMVVCLHESLGKLAAGEVVDVTDIQRATIEGAVHRLRPKLRRRRTSDHQAHHPKIFSCDVGARKSENDRRDLPIDRGSEGESARCGGARPGSAPSSQCNGRR
jgi:hypothetical protein